MLLLFLLSVDAIEKQKNASKYDGYSYEYPMLKLFTNKQTDANDDDLDSSMRRAKKSAMKTLSSTRNLSSSGSPSKAAFNGASTRRMNMKKTQSVFIRGI